MQVSEHNHYDSSYVELVRQSLDYVKESDKVQTIYLMQMQ